MKLSHNTHKTQAYNIYFRCFCIKKLFRHSFGKKVTKKCAKTIRPLELRYPWGEIYQNKTACTKAYHKPFLLKQKLNSRSFLPVVDLATRFMPLARAAAAVGGGLSCSGDVTLWRHTGPRGSADCKELCVHVHRTRAHTLMDVKNIYHVAKLLHYITNNLYGSKYLIFRIFHRNFAFEDP
jgi:hypothetical protein